MREISKNNIAFFVTKIIQHHLKTASSGDITVPEELYVNPQSKLTLFHQPSP